MNKAARRFVNESLSYKLLGDEALSQKDHASYIVFDDNIRRAKMKESPKDAKLWGAVDEGKEMSYAVYGNSIEEAVKKAGLDPKALKATIEQYNKLAPFGKDPLGRKSLSSGYGKPVAIVKPPFVIMPATAGMIGTYCGVCIDFEAHVIDVFGERINGLYAAGEMTGGIHGAAYMTGTAFGKALSFGHLAADVIAKSE